MTVNLKIDHHHHYYHVKDLRAPPDHFNQFSHTHKEIVHFVSDLLRIWDSKMDCVSLVLRSLHMK